MSKQHVKIDYTNHRGERSVRMIQPRAIAFDMTEWHPDQQWLLEAYDVEKGAGRTFAMKDIHGWDVKPGPAGQTLDGMMAAQLRRSMELNARMKIRLQKLAGAYRVQSASKLVEAIETIMRDEDVPWLT